MKDSLERKISSVKELKTGIDNADKFVKDVYKKTKKGKRKVV